MTAIPLDIQAAPVLPLAPDRRRHSAFETTDAIDAIGSPTDRPDSSPAPPLPGRYLALGEDHVPLPITQAITHIGRGFGATLQLEDPSVSRRHAIVLERRGTLRILDDRSANGTFVNGRRVAEAELRDGDTIQLGRVVLMFVEVPAQAA
jgi:pSer/pThr/pTyr-binding forkhead associated (FHA) protein